MNNHKSTTEERRCTGSTAYPCSVNFCAGAYPDWLEVNLLPECNAKCEWCIEKNGYHPDRSAPWQEIAAVAIDHGAKNIILLGGEPTLYKNLPEIIRELSHAGRRVWITTNGALLSEKFAQEKLSDVYGINISIHDYDLPRNKAITGLDLNYEILKSAIKVLVGEGASVRLNCNCIVGNIDSEPEMLNYIEFARSVGVTSVRFAELKQAADSFVDIAEAVCFKYGTNNDPFSEGCSSFAVINGVNVNFRQMCGLQTANRPAPENPKQEQKHVLYYDGIIYNGWQITKEVETVTNKELLKLMNDVADGKITPDEAALKCARCMEPEKAKTVIKHVPVTASGGCQY